MDPKRIQCWDRIRPSCVLTRQGVMNTSSISCVHAKLMVVYRNYTWWKCVIPFVWRQVYSISMRVCSFLVIHSICDVGLQWSLHKRMWWDWTGMAETPILISSEPWLIPVMLKSIKRRSFLIRRLSQYFTSIMTMQRARKSDLCSMNW